MATLTGPELTTVRNYCEHNAFAGAYTKAQINAVLQAIEDAMTTRLVIAGDVGKTWPQVISGVIDAASAATFTNIQKRVLFALWAQLKYGRDK